MYALNERQSMGIRWRNLPDIPAGKEHSYLFDLFDRAKIAYLGQVLTHGQILSLTKSSKSAKKHGFYKKRGSYFVTRYMRLEMNSILTKGLEYLRDNRKGNSGHQRGHCKQTKLTKEDEESIAAEFVQKADNTCLSLTTFSKTTAEILEITPKTVRNIVKRNTKPDRRAVIPNLLSSEDMEARVSFAERMRTLQWQKYTVFFDEVKT